MSMYLRSIKIVRHDEQCFVGMRLSLLRGLCGHVIPQLCSQPLERLSKLVLALSVRPYAPERVLV